MIQKGKKHRVLAVRYVRVIFNPHAVSSDMAGEENDEIIDCHDNRSGKTITHMWHLHFKWKTLRYKVIFHTTCMCLMPFFFFFYPAGSAVGLGHDSNLVSRLRHSIRDRNVHLFMVNSRAGPIVCESRVVCDETDCSGVAAETVSRSSLFCYS